MLQAPTDTRLGFTDLSEEVVVDELELEGALPSWLGGSLLRTGPARWDLGEQTVNHWFDGLAMLHRFTIGGGRVSYANRFLRSRAYEAAERDGRIAYSEFATDPCRSAFKRLATAFRPALTDNGAVNVAPLLGDWVALTETPMAVRFDPQTLETLGVTDLPVTTGGIAHPHGDDGHALFMGVHMGPRNSYRLLRDDRVIARLPVREPAYVHSFGLTPRFAVLVEHPYTVNPLRLAFAGRPFIENFRWHPERGTRLRVIDRASGRHDGDWRTDALFMFHTINAFEDGADIVLDLCAYDDPGVVDALALGRLRNGELPPLAHATRLRLRADGGVERTVLSDTPFELPRIDYGRVNGRPYRYTWGMGGIMESIVRLDTETGDVRTWSDGSHPGEPVYVGRPGREREDDGVLLSVTLEPERGTSSLVVLDAESLEEVARARVPHHVPFGFHGQFARSTG
jgi:carotenoid cleavage dioxygenase-like enzyme